MTTLTISVAVNNPDAEDRKTMEDHIDMENAWAEKDDIKLELKAIKEAYLAGDAAKRAAIVAAVK